MECTAFGRCGSCQLYNLKYPEQVEWKRERVLELFNRFETPELEIYTGPESHYRARAEFRVWLEGGRLFYGMREKGNGRKIVPIEQCEIVDPAIYSFMPLLRRELEARPHLLPRLYEIDFLSNSRGELIVTIIYHRPVTPEIVAGFREIKEKYPTHHFVLRKKGRKELLDRNWLIEELEVGGETYYYQIVENTFTQPNRHLNRQMIGWALEVTDGLQGDLVELYCGNGNFTIPLAKKRFRKVVATEINRESIGAAIEGARLNRIENITFLAMSAAKFAGLVEEESPLLKGYNLETILVDPPRAGLDPKSRQFVNSFKNILYISCNPETLRRDLEVLGVGRRIERFALFDQFPYTPHIEMGVFLRPKES